MAKGLEGCTILGVGSAFVEHPANLYKLPIRGGMFEHSRIYKEDSGSYDYYQVIDTPEDVLDALLTDVEGKRRKNLFILELTKGKNSYTDYNAIAELYNKFVNVVAYNYNVEHLLLNINDIYNPYSSENKTDYIHLFLDTLSPKALLLQLGIERFSKIKSINYNGYSPYFMKKVFDDNDLFNKFYDYFQEASNLEFFGMDFTGLYTTNQKNNMVTFFKSLKNVKYISLITYTDYYHLTNYLGSNKFDYYKYSIDKNTTDFNIQDWRLKEAVYDNLEEEPDWLPPKTCNFYWYLYHRYRGNVINGYPFKKLPYQRPDDKWDVNTPIGEVDEDN